MNEALNRTNARAELVDERAMRDLARRAEAAHELRSRCARYTAVMELALAQQLPAAKPVVGLSELACAVLALVAHFVTGGAAGVEVGAWELAYAYRQTSLRPVWTAIAELRDGWLIVTPILVPAAETKIGGPYKSRTDHRGKRRSQRSDEPDAHPNSQVRNVYTLGTKALAAGFGKRCEQAEGKPAEKQVCTATCSALFSVSGSDSGSGFFPVGGVDNSSVSAGPEAENEGSASSPRSTFPLEPRDGDSLLEAARSVDASTPFVAGELGDVDQVGDGDGSEAVNRGAARRGLFAAAGWRLARLFGRGDS